MLRQCSTALLIALAAGQAQAATNLLTNPEFDVTDVPWAIVFDFGGTSAYSSIDSDGCGASGSIRGVADLLGSSAYMDQCVAVPPGQPPSRARVRVRGEGNNSAVNLIVGWIGAGAPCAGAELGVTSAPAGSTALDAWTLHETPVANVPAGTVYARISVFFDGPKGNFAVYADRVYLGDGREIFSEDLEIEETCRFSSTQP